MTSFVILQSHQQITILSQVIIFANTTINTFLPERKQFFLSTNLFLLRFGSIIADKNIEVSITNRRKNKIHSQIRSEFPIVGGKYIGFINYF